jgi:UDP-N-acetylglucosamine 2-epimerase
MIWHDIQIPFAGNAGGKILNYFSKVIAAIPTSVPLIGGDTHRDSMANVAAGNRRITVFSCVKSRK